MLSAEDPQFRTAFPDRKIADAELQPGSRLSPGVQTVMEGYAGRPALGRRARTKYVADLRYPGLL